MNRHRLGGTKGLSLRKLEVKNTSTAKNSPLRWKHQWSARIIDGELFLCACHTLRGYNEGDLCRAVDGEYLDICHHVGMSPSSLVRPTFSLDPRQGVVGSCKMCLTDYVSKIEWQDAKSKSQQAWYRIQSGDLRRMRGSRRWSINVTAYHQVCDGRSTKDWKWMALAGQLLIGLRRESGDYPPGSVVERWHGASDYHHSSNVPPRFNRRSVADNQDDYYHRHQLSQAFRSLSSATLSGGILRRVQLVPLRALGPIRYMKFVENTF